MSCLLLISSTDKEMYKNRLMTKRYENEPQYMHIAVV